MCHFKTNSLIVYVKTNEIFRSSRHKYSKNFNHMGGDDRACQVNELKGGDMQIF